MNAREEFDGWLASIDARLADAQGQTAIVAAERDAALEQVRTISAERDGLRDQVRSLQTRVSELEAQIPKPVAMKLGNGWGVSVATYNADRNARGYRMIMNYRPLEPKFADVANIPAGDTIWLQSKATTKAAFAATIDSIPADRAKDVVLYPWNEAAAKLTLADFRTYMGWCRELIDASGKPIRLGNQQADWILFPAANVDEDAWFTGHEDVMGWSGFANAKVKDGVTVAALNPTQLMDLVDAYSERHDGIPYAFPVWGMPIIVGTDGTQSRVNRLDWMKTTYARMVASGCESAGYYDGLWTRATGGDLDYRITSDPTHLQPWWNQIKAAHS